MSLETVGQLQELEQERIALCDDYSDLLRELTDRIIPILDGAEPQHVPAELEPLIRDAMHQAASTWSNATCVLSSSYQYNYAVGAYDISPWYHVLRVPHTTEDIEEFILFELPRIEKESVPLHAVLLGHEIGHLCVWSSNLLGTFQFELPDELFGPDRSSGELDSLRPFYSRWCKKWLEELAADIFSTLMLGPAALFSLTELAGTVNSLHADSNSHPNTQRRLIVMMRTLELLGFMGIPSLRQAFEPYQEVVAGYPYPTSPPPAQGEEDYGGRIVWHVLSPYLQEDTLHLACEDNLPRRLWFPSTDWSNVEAAIDLLKRGMPAGELRVDGRNVLSSPAIVLNAAWYLKSDGLQSLESELGLDPDRLSTVMRSNYILDQLVLKSFEIIAKDRRGP